MEKNTSWNQHLFSSLTVQQLKSFGKAIGLHGYYKMRKTELVATIVEHLLKKETIISFLWQQPINTITLLQNFSDTKKIMISSHETEACQKPFFYGYLNCSEADIDLIGEDTVDTLLNSNVTLNPAFQVIFQQWLKDESASYFSQREIIDYCLAAVNLWGVAPMTEISKIYINHNHEILSVAKIKETIEQFPYGNSLSFSVVDNFIVSNAILTNDSLAYLIEKKQGKPYYMPHKETFLQYAYEHYLETTMHTQAYSNFLIETLHTTPWIAKKILEETIHLIETEHPLHDMIDLLAKNNIICEEEAILGELVFCLNNLMNNTRLWYNNGHTPKEIHPASNATLSPKKIGRNSPCPCGSGKKYKHCCGKN